MPTATATIPPFDELEGSPTEEWPETGSFKATRVLKTAWSNRANLVLALKGGVSGGFTYAPSDYPHLAGCKCTSASSRPWDNKSHAHGGATNVAGWDFAEVTVQYGGSGQNGGSGTNAAGDPIVETVEPNVEFLQLPADGFRWGGTNGAQLKDEEAPGKVFRSAVYVYKRSGLSSIPSDLFDLIGKVNDGSVVSYTLGKTFATETLLYCPPFLEHTINADGTESWGFTLRFHYKPDGWNRFWRQDKNPPGFDRIYNKDGPADPYLKASFSTIRG